MLPCCWSHWWLHPPKAASMCSGPSYCLRSWAWGQSTCQKHVLHSCRPQNPMGNGESTEQRLFFCRHHHPRCNGGSTECRLKLLHRFCHCGGSLTEHFKYAILTSRALLRLAINCIKCPNVWWVTSLLQLATFCLTFNTLIVSHYGFLFWVYLILDFILEYIKFISCIKFRNFWSYFSNSLLLCLSLFLSRFFLCI